jgi:DNA-binding LytR/AlgR family response regulator
VAYFRGDGNYIEIRLKAGGAEYHRRTLDSLAKILPPQFSRIHRSYIVDRRDVKWVVSQGGGVYDVELKDGAKLPLSRAHYKDFKDLVSD